VLFVLASRGFSNPNFLNVRAELERAGIGWVVASSTTAAALPETIKGAPPGGGPRAVPDIQLREVRSADFAAIIFCGGRGAIAEYAGEGLHAAEARRVIREALEAKKHVAALENAPVVLADAGALRGVRATCSRWGTPMGSYIQFLENAGAEWVDESVVVSGLIITARDVHAGQELGRVVAEQVLKP
jgi:protease I